MGKVARMGRIAGRRLASSEWRQAFAAALGCACLWFAPHASAAGPVVQAVAVQAATERSPASVVLTLSAGTDHKAFALDNPPRLVVDLAAAAAAPQLELPAATAGTAGPVAGVRVANRGTGLRVVVDLASATAYRTRLVPASKGQPARLEVELGEAAAAKPDARASLTAVPVPAPASAAVVAPKAVAVVVPVPITPPPAGAPPPVRAEPASPAVARAREPRAGRDLVIAVDAGHGGKDPGAHGLNGTQEKDVTLAVARRLAAALGREPGMRAYLVRDGDYFVELRQRMVRARTAGADLFVSIHADAAYNRAAAGSSVYILSTRGASSEAARWLADRENAADLAGGVQLDKVDPTVASVLMDLSQGDTITSSDRAARLVLSELDRIGNVHKREVQSAGFMVLKSPDIPSMLVETAFISHPAEEERLSDPEHQQRLAEAIQNGVRAYFYNNPPPGTRVAQLAAKRRDAARILAAGP
ncbi:MAG: hypothetical protein RJB26_1786 [Pseudomonadota bacterium]